VRGDKIKDRIVAKQKCCMLVGQSARNRRRGFGVAVYRVRKGSQPSLVVPREGHKPPKDSQRNEHW
jgi:hypothetical protein